jgi:pyrroline-5-carboxylate reductase
MSITENIAFLGAGNMATALIEGILRAKVCAPSQIIASDIDAARLQQLAAAHGIRTTTSNAEACKGASILVLCVKPQVFPQLAEDLHAHGQPGALAVSIMAGVPISAMEAKLPKGCRVVRAMPNTPALVQASATALAAGTLTSESDIALAQKLFDAVGISIVVKEPLLDAVTGLSGSGPAYVFRMIEGLVEAGVEAGLTEAQALALTAQTVLGAGKLVQNSSDSPAELRRKVTSPGGTTVAGLGALEERGFFDAVKLAVQRATTRATELGVEAAQRLGK